MQTLLTSLNGSINAVTNLSQLLTGLLNGPVSLGRQLWRGCAAVLSRFRITPATVPYETLWLDLALDLADPRGERAVLTRRQRVRFLTPEMSFVRELFWGEGRPLVRYRVRGARRTAVRLEGSKRAVLLEPASRSAAGDRLTITSRRTITGGFREPQEYFEAFLERPTGQLNFTILFPPKRPPRAGWLVLATREQVLRSIPTRYGADGRAILRCRLRKPAVAVTYSLRWAW